MEIVETGDKNSDVTVNIQFSERNGCFVKSVLERLMRKMSCFSGTDQSTNSITSKR